MELKDAQVLVVKVGTSTLTYENGKVNLRRLERLCRTLSDLQNAGRKLVLVSCPSAPRRRRKSRRWPPLASAS